MGVPMKKKDSKKLPRQPNLSPTPDWLRDLQAHAKLTMADIDAEIAAARRDGPRRFNNGELTRA
jgi:hypothetical protein